MIWEPFILALVLGSIVSAGLYFAYLWPSVEPVVDDAPAHPPGIPTRPLPVETVLPVTAASPEAPATDPPATPATDPPATPATDPPATPATDPPPTPATDDATSPAS